MKVLFLTDESPDYGADFLYDGFKTLADRKASGFCIDYPNKPSLHGRKLGFDCDLDHQGHGWSEELVESAFERGEFDLIVVPSLRGGIKMRLRDWRKKLVQYEDRIACFDMEDNDHDTRHFYEHAVGFPLRYFYKREIRWGQTFAVSFPLSYPASRKFESGAIRSPLTLCNWHLWKWCKKGTMRRDLADNLHLVSKQVTVGVTRTPEDRVTLKENQQAMRQHVAAAVPAGQGYGTNRFFEVIANGCLPIVQKSPMQMINGYAGGIDCLEFETVGQFIECVDWVFNNPASARQIADRAQERWLRYHTTEARAQQVWDTVQGGRRNETEKSDTDAGSGEQPDFGEAAASPWLQAIRRRDESGRDSGTS